MLVARGPTPHTPSLKFKMKKKNGPLRAHLEVMNNNFDPNNFRVRDYHQKYEPLIYGHNDCHH
jgi:hypothetical protein